MQEYVYFVRSGTHGPIKIGRAVDPHERLRQLQTGSPVELRLLGTIPGGVDLEAALHDLLGDSRLRGEWFRPTVAVRAYAVLATAIDGRHPEEIASWQIAETALPMLRRAGIFRRPQEEIPVVSRPKHPLNPCKRRHFDQ